MNIVAHALHLTIPRESNNFKARILHPSRLFLLSLFVVAFQIWLNFLPKPQGLTLGYAANIPPAEVVRLTNTKRVGVGLSSLVVNDALALAAQKKGEHMLANDYWAHIAPDGTEPWKFFSDVGYNYRFAGENLARDFTNPNSAVEAWMASPSHRDNLLSDRYTEIGIAVVEGDLNGKDTTLVVQLFGRPTGTVAPSVPVAEAAPQTQEVPAPEVQPAVEEPEIQETPAEQPIAVKPPPAFESRTSPLSVTKVVSLSVAGAMLVVLATDEILVIKRGVARMRGRIIAHVSFFATILVIIVVVQSGSIL